MTGELDGSKNPSCGGCCNWLSFLEVSMRDPASQNQMILEEAARDCGTACRTATARRMNRLFRDCPSVHRSPCHIGEMSRMPLPMESYRVPV
jgi:hypothetical protein